MPTISLLSRISRIIKSEKKTISFFPYAFGAAILSVSLGVPKEVKRSWNTLTDRALSGIKTTTAHKKGKILLKVTSDKPELYKIKGADTFEMECKELKKTKVRTVDFEVEKVSGISEVRDCVLKVQLQEEISKVSWPPASILQAVIQNNIRASQIAMSGSSLTSYQWNCSQSVSDSEKACRQRHLVIVEKEKTVRTKVERGDSNNVSCWDHSVGKLSQPDKTLPFTCGSDEVIEIFTVFNDSGILVETYSAGEETSQFFGKNLKVEFTSAKNERIVQVVNPGYEGKFLMKSEARPTRLILKGKELEERGNVLEWLDKGGQFTSIMGGEALTPQQEKLCKNMGIRLE